MRRAVSLFCALTLLITLAVPVRAADSSDERGIRQRAADSGDERGIKQRVAEIQETYGITVKYSKSVQDQVPEYLDDLETALRYIGPLFTKRLSSHFLGKGWNFKVEIVPFPEKQHADQPWIDALFTYNSARGYDQMISLYVKPTKQLKVETIVHEFGHALHNCLGYSDFARINGGKKSYGGAYDPLDTNRYVSSYATLDHFEDFAETFMVMVTRNPQARAAYADLQKNTPLYKKYHYIYEQMDEFLGSGCRATKRAAEFLGV